MYRSILIDANGLSYNYILIFYVCIMLLNVAYFITWGINSGINTTRNVLCKNLKKSVATTQLYIFSK